jgi:protein-S-isoprenylcysteine O-methyltransferase Ste14
MSARAQSERPMHRHFPAPLSVLGTLIAGLALQRWHPLGSLEGAPRWALGSALCAAGFAFGLSAVVSMRRHRTSPSPFHRPNALVADGPFRFSRNPMYVSMVLLVAGAAVLLADPWLLVLLPVLVIAILFGAILPEERTMSEVFGEEFARYRAKVRRWL